MVLSTGDGIVQDGACLLRDTQRIAMDAINRRLELIGSARIWGNREVLKCPLVKLTLYHGKQYVTPVCHHLDVRVHDPSG
jgi:hypothetical protein